MKFKDAAKNDDVVEALESIEDKLYERGFLVSATGDNQCNVYIQFKTFSFNDGEGQYLVIAIDSEEPSKEDFDKFREILNYVVDKFSDLSVSLPKAVLKALEERNGELVTLNGNVVFAVAPYTIIPWKQIF